MPVTITRSNPSWWFQLSGSDTPAAYQALAASQNAAWLANPANGLMVATSGPVGDVSYAFDGAPIEAYAYKQIMIDTYPGNFLRDTQALRSLANDWGINNLLSDYEKFNELKAYGFYAEVPIFKQWLASYNATSPAAIAAAQQAAAIEAERQRVAAANDAFYLPVNQYLQSLSLDDKNIPAAIAYAESMGRTVNAVYPGLGYDNLQKLPAPFYSDFESGEAVDGWVWKTRAEALAQSAQYASHLAAITPSKTRDDLHTYQGLSGLWWYDFNVDHTQPGRPPNYDAQAKNALEQYALQMFGEPFSFNAMVQHAIAPAFMAQYVADNPVAVEYLNRLTPVYDAARAAINAVMLNLYGTWQRNVYGGFDAAPLLDKKTIGLARIYWDKIGLTGLLYAAAQIDLQNNTPAERSLYQSVANKGFIPWSRIIMQERQPGLYRAATREIIESEMRSSIGGWISLATFIANAGLSFAGIPSLTSWSTFGKAITSHVSESLFGIGGLLSPLEFEAIDGFFTGDLGGDLVADFVDVPDYYAIQIAENAAAESARLAAEYAAAEAARIAAEEAALIAAEEAARIAAEETARIAAEEAARIAAEYAASEAARIAAEEATRLAAEYAAAEAARIAAEEAARVAAEEAARIAAEEAARVAAEEAARIAAEYAAAEAARIAAEESARIAAEYAAAEAARIAAEEAARIAAEEAARIAAEEAARIAAEESARLAAEYAAAESARIAAEESARLAAEYAAAESARIAAEEAARIAAEEAAQIAAEEAARIAAEEAARIAQEYQDALNVIDDNAPTVIETGLTTDAPIGEGNTNMPPLNEWPDGFDLSEGFDPVIDAWPDIPGEVDAGAILDFPDQDFGLPSVDDFNGIDYGGAVDLPDGFDVESVDIFPVEDAAPEVPTFTDDGGTEYYYTPDYAVQVDEVAAVVDPDSGSVVITDEDLSYTIAPPDDATVIDAELLTIDGVFDDAAFDWSSIPFGQLYAVAQQRQATGARLPNGQTKTYPNTWPGLMASIVDTYASYKLALQSKGTAPGNTGAAYRNNSGSYTYRNPQTGQIIRTNVPPTTLVNSTTGKTAILIGAAIVAGLFLFSKRG